MKDQKQSKISLTLNPQTKPILQSLLGKTITSFGHQARISSIIKHTICYREEKGLIFATTSDPKMYIPQLWNHFFADSSHESTDTQIISSQHSQSAQSQQQNISYPKPSTNQILLEAALSRQNNIWDELRGNKLKIQIRPKYKQPQKAEQMLTKKQSKQLDESKASANSQKDFLQFIKAQKMQRQRRKKLMQMQQQKQLQRQKKQVEQQQKNKQAQQAKLRQQKRLKQQQVAKKRQTQKQLIKRHQSVYNEFQNKIYHSTQKPESQNLFQRFQSEQLKKIKQDKQKLYKSFDRERLDEHQKTYIDSVQKRNEERYKRMEEVKQIEEMQNQKSRVKFRSSFKFEKPQEEYEKRKRQEYIQAKEKRDRIMSYKEKVKSDFVPEVDQNKKNQLLKLMEDLEMSRNGQYRKKVLKDGEVVMERIDLKDAREVGLNYLQEIKKEVAKMRAMKRESGDSFMDSAAQEDPKLKKPIDYLKQMRESKSKSTSGFTSPRKTGLMNTKCSGVSFDEKMKKIEDIATKLMQKTKQQEMLLKYGKFKTSEEILSKKEIIDRNYIDLLNMKLEMIERQEGRLGS